MRVGGGQGHSGCISHLSHFYARFAPASSAVAHLRRLNLFVDRRGCLGFFRHRENWRFTTTLLRRPGGTESLLSVRRSLARNTHPTWRDVKDEKPRRTMESKSDGLLGTRNAARGARRNAERETQGAREKKRNAKSYPFFTSTRTRVCPSRLRKNVFQFERHVFICIVPRVSTAVILRRRKV